MVRSLFGIAFLMLASSPGSAQVGKGKGDSGRFGWSGDFTAAKAEAKRTGKPIMVVFRCEPCGECGEFDELVTRLDKEIASTADKFVRVRLTRITGVDLRLFEFDYDVTWFAFFLNADEHIYGRYGGRDVADAMSRISLKGLRFAMEQALDAHQNPPAAALRTDKPLKVEDFAAARKVKGGCVHCHLVNEFTHADLKASGKWERDRVWVYPPPENIGLKLDVDRGNLVREVLADKPAAKLGIKSGDTLKLLNDRPVASFADASFALHKAPKSGVIPVTWLRDGKETSAQLAVVDNWRKTNLSWRPSMLNFLPRLEFSGDDLDAGERKSLGLTDQQVAFKQDKFVHSTLKAVGIQKDDVVLGIDGKKADGSMASFLSMVRGGYLVGDKVQLDILRDGKPMAIPMTLK